MALMKKKRLADYMKDRMVGSDEAEIDEGPVETNEPSGVSNPVQSAKNNGKRLNAANRRKRKTLQRGY